MRILYHFFLSRKLSIILVVSVFASCQKNKDSIHPEQSSITESVYASGLLISKNQYKVYCEAGGIVDQVFVDEGEPVEKGSPILSIVSDNQVLSRSNEALSAAFNAYEANKGKLEEAKSFADLALSQLRLDSALFARQKRLWEQNIGTKLSLEQRELAFESSKANYLSAVEKVETLQRQLSYQSQQAQNNLKISQKLTQDFVVKSEIKGKVYEINVKKGEMVSPQMVVAILGAERQFLLEMQVDENDIVSIREGMRVKVVLNSHKDTVFDALVTKINPMMNVQSKTFTVEASFVQAPATLYPNISFEANVLINTKEKALLIPRKYLLNDTMVVLISGERVKVTTGLKDYQKVEILSGIGIEDELILP